MSMIQIGDVVVSLDLFTEHFCCDLEACHGACCIEGDAGAPVTLDEIASLEEVLPVIEKNLSPKARAVIEKQGVAYSDASGELVTSIVEGKDCVFSTTDEKGVCYCAIERAWAAGKVHFRKPISCHLYPIRVGQIGPYEALNYHRWEVCKAAVLMGEQRGIPLYRALREPLLRKFGEAWYQELETVAAELKKQKYI